MHTRTLAHTLTDTPAHTHSRAGKTSWPNEREEKLAKRTKVESKANYINAFRSGV